jgi:hypothetical protein
MPDIIILFVLSVDAILICWFARTSSEMISRAKDLMCLTTLQISLPRLLKVVMVLSLLKHPNLDTLGII